MSSEKRIDVTTRGPKSRFEGGGLIPEGVALRPGIGERLVPEGCTILSVERIPTRIGPSPSGSAWSRQIYHLDWAAYGLSVCR